jgi:hypothetical protein
LRLPKVIVSFGGSDGSHFFLFQSIRVKAK